MKQKIYLFFLMAILIILYYLVLKKNNFTKIFEFFDNTIVNCPEGYALHNNKCVQVCAGCKLGTCKNGICGSDIPNVFPI